MGGLDPGLGQQVITTARSIAVLVAVSVAVLGCGDPGFGVSVVNRSEQLLIVRFQSQGGTWSSVRVKPGDEGLAFGDLSYDMWEGAAVEVLSVDCKQLAAVPEAGPNVAYVIGPTLQVNVIDISSASDTARQSELASTQECGGAVPSG
jgi:hypothetical protein